MSQAEAEVNGSHAAPWPIVDLIGQLHDELVISYRQKVAQRPGRGGEHERVGAQLKGAVQRPAQVLVTRRRSSHTDLRQAEIEVSVHTRWRAGLCVLIGATGPGLERRHRKCLSSPT